MIKRKMVDSGCGVRCQKCGRVIPNGAYALRTSGPTRWQHETACEPAAATTTTEHATERQVAYAADLMLSVWTPAVLGGRRYSREQLSAMSKEQIGRIIDALVSERELQAGY